MADCFTSRHGCLVQPEPRRCGCDDRLRAEPLPPHRTDTRCLPRPKESRSGLASSGRRRLAFRRAAGRSDLDQQTLVRAFGPSEHGPRGIARPHHRCRRLNLVDALDSHHARHRRVVEVDRSRHASLAGIEMPRNDRLRSSLAQNVHVESQRGFDQARSGHQDEGNSG